MVLEYVPSNLQVVDILTKPLHKRKFEMLREKLGLVENTFLTKECQFYLLLSIFSLNNNKSNLNPCTEKFAIDG